MELKNRNQIVADGHERWLTARAEKVRVAVRKNIAGQNQRAGGFGKIRLWFKIEMAAWRGQKADGKSSPKIHW